MQKQAVIRASASAILMTLFLLPRIAHAANVTVGCPGGKGGTYTSINAALASLDPSADNAIIVSGACTENVDISGFDRLNLIAQNGSSIADASGGAVSVVNIFNSPSVTVQGFTINGGGPNATETIDCNFSTCTFRGNTVQGGGDGVDVFNGGHAFFVNDVFQDLGVGATGIFLGGNAFALARGVTIQRVAGDGVEVVGSFLQIIDSTVENNAGNGIFVNLNGTANIRHSTVMGNAGDGVEVIGHSTISLGGVADTTGTSITGNHGVGVLVKDLSFARFPQGVPNVVKNNLGGTDVLCSPKFPVTRGAPTNIGGGRTNCVEGGDQ